MPGKLSFDEKRTLLQIARRSMIEAVSREKVTPIQLENLPARLQQDGASFVTLTKEGELRGCIGTLEAYQPLALDVQEHAIAAALEDYRFNPVTPGELDQIEMEISWLSEPQDIDYDKPDSLPDHLRPGVDGVILQDGFRKATFLPQVWQQLPDPKYFLSHLCQKMGASADLWRRRKLQVKIYQVEEFNEGHTL